MYFENFKKVVLIGITALSLTSCDVHFGETHFDVYPWVIGIPVALIFVIAHCIIIFRIYECPECKTKFRPRWYEVSSWLHDGNRRVVRCPHCQRKGFCRPADESEDQ